jgi:hypothetical protein
MCPVLTKSEIACSIGWISGLHVQSWGRGRRPDLASRDSATGDTRMLQGKWIERTVGAERKVNELPDLNWREFTAQWKNYGY